MVRTLLHSTRPLKARTTMPFATQSLRCKMPTTRLSLKCCRCRPGSCSVHSTLAPTRRALKNTEHERQGREIHKSNGGEPHSIYPPSASSLSFISPLCLHATSVRDSIHIHSQTPQHQRSRVMPVVYLPLCLPFAVIVTLLDVSLEQDAHLPLSLPGISSIYPSRFCLCRVLFSNAKPPLGAESVHGALEHRVAHSSFGYTQRKKHSHYKMGKCLGNGWGWGSFLQDIEGRP